MLPGFGLAECSVALTIPPLNRKFLIDRVERDNLTQDQIALKVTDQHTPRYGICFLWHAHTWT